MKLGDKVKDKISGLVGILTGRSEFLNGCVRWMVQPQETKDGKPVDATWMDEEQLDLVEAEAVTISARPGGGPRPDARRAADACR